MIFVGRGGRFQVLERIASSEIILGNGEKRKDFLMSRIPFRVVELIEAFDRNTKALHLQEYNENQLSREFIEPFFEE